MGRLWGLSTGDTLSVASGEQFWVQAHPQLFRLMQAGGQLLGWGLAALLVGMMMGSVRTTLGLVPPGGFSWVAIAPLILIAMIPLAQFSTFQADTFHLPGFLQKMEAGIAAREAKLKAVISTLTRETHTGAFVANLLLLAVIPAVCEELFFRGVVQRSLALRLSPHLAIWLTALIFSVVHFQFYGFFSRMLLGGALGYLAWFAGSIWPAIAGHLAFNGFQIVALWYAQRQRPELVAKLSDDAQIPAGLALLSLLLTLLLFWFYIRTLKPAPL